jgi:hypothetical protein
MNNKNVYPTFSDTQFLHLLDLRITQSGHFDHLGRIKDVYLQLFSTCRGVDIQDI